MAIEREAGIEFNVPDFSKITSKNEVFYNPAMSFNRDVSLLYLSTQGKDISILCGMAGSGVRAIRYAKNGFRNITANDINPRACEIIKRNVSDNGVSVRTTNLDFNLINEKYDAIDIDPFGSPVRYVPPSMRMLRKTGHLLITATDTAALCGSSKKACIRKYSAYPMKTTYCHEIGLRILLGYVVRQAASWGYGTYPRICFFKDHYMRLHVELEKGKRRADDTMESMGFIHHCEKCLNRFFSTAPRAQCECGHKLRMAYPLWGGHLNDSDAIDSILDNVNEVQLHNDKEVVNFLSSLKDELDVPYFWDSHEVFSHLRMPVPQLPAIIEKLRMNGHGASKTHMSPTSFKTFANNIELAQIFSEK